MATLRFEAAVLDTLLEAVGLPDAPLPNLVLENVAFVDTAATYLQARGRIFCPDQGHGMVLSATKSAHLPLCGTLQSDCIGFFHTATVCLKATAPYVTYAARPLLEEFALSTWLPPSCFSAEGLDQARVGQGC